MKISSFLVGIVLIGLFATVFGVFFANISTQYNQEYNSTSFDSYNKIQNITTQSEAIREGLETEGGDTGLTDLVGGFLKKGFAVVKLTFQSFDLMNSMAGDAANEIDARTGGGAGVNNYFLPAVMAILSILFIFIIISMLVGREL